ncbi:type II secretion system secretin GspD [Crenothrix sp.]|uniref:type II secretion system secretin GspD n=1 Tax=Crenothrix sp. TaxID=3100433 RepID=UPI00374D5E12
MNNFKKLTTASYLVAAALTLSGCELLLPRPKPKIPLPPLAKEQYKQPVTYQELQNKPIATDQLRAKIELFPARSQFSETPPVAKHRRTMTNGVGTYSLNFDEADLGEVAKVILSDILGQNYVLSPKVAGKVTLQTTQPLSKEELLPTLEMVLRMNNAALVKDGKIFHIEPSAEALYTSDISTGAGAKAGYQTRVITIHNVGVQNIVDIIKPLVRDKTILNVDPTRNSMILSGTPDELARIMDMVSTFDTDLLRGRSFALFSLAHVDPEKVIEELNAVFGKKGGKTDDNEFFRFIPIERMNAVLAITHQASYLRDIENWVYRLDKANTASGGGVNVYKVQHMDAVELADQLNDIFGSGGGSGKRDKAGKVAPGQSSGDLTNKDNSSPDTSSGISADAPSSSVSKKSSKKSSSSGSTGGAKVANVDDVKIVADEANNAVVVVSTAREYAIILPIIKQLDIMPLQVLIDATIADVTLRDNLSYGIQWYLNNSAAGPGGTTRTVTNPNTGVVTTTTTGGTGGADLMNLAAGAITGGLGYTFLSHSGDIRMVLTAEANKGNVNIMSSPSLMVLNNQEANIQVGDEISLVTGALSGVSSTATPDTGNNSLIQNTQNQQRKTGVKLKVKPRVNANGMVLLDIEQSVEDVDPDKKTGGGNPTILTRSINSSVAVQSGETLVLGGLIRETNNNSKTGIPFLHELPLIGPLFGNTSIAKTRTELVVLITPRVVKSLQDTRIVTDEFRRKLTGMYDYPGNNTKKEWYIRD